MEQLASDGVAQRSAVFTPVPAFGSSVYRFPAEDGRHQHSDCAQPELKVDNVTYTHARQIKGWATTDDFVKPRGQATSAKATSYMAHPSTPPLPSSSLLDLVLRSTNEMRLQELYELYHRRKLIGPGPGEHDAKRVKAKQSHHRPHVAGRDGPKILKTGQPSTRAREMEHIHCAHNQGSGLGPGYYDGTMGKDSCLRNWKMGGRIGSSLRNGTRGTLAYTPSVSAVISHYLDAAGQESPENQQMGARRTPYGLAYPDDVGMFRAATPVQHDGQPRRPTEITCIPHTAAGTQVAVPAPCDMEKPADFPQKNVAVAKRSMSMTGRQQQSKVLPKQPPCPPQLLISASHCDLPGEWDWSSLKRTVRGSFSTQGGGCHRNSRTASYFKMDSCQHVQQQDARFQSFWEAPDGSCAHSGTQLEIPASMETIPEDGTVVPTRHGRVPKHKQAECSALLSESDIRSHALANSYAEEVRAIEMRRRRWVLHSRMYSSMLPLVKNQIAMGTYNQLE